MTYLASKPFIFGGRAAVDIGCRDGEYTRYLQQDFDHVYGFDARDRRTFTVNVDTLRATHFVTALGDQEGDITMYGGTHDPNHSKPHVIRCHTLDSFGLKDVDYIKIDVEGFETKVLKGAAETIARCRPLIVIEQNEVALPDEPPLLAKTWLEARGYRHVATCPRGWDHIMAPS